VTTSSYFHHLRNAYQAELDDLRSDSEGHDVLRKRLAEKRRELDFLVQMMELSPEMVAVVLHQAFRFTNPALMENVTSLESDELPEWSSLRDTIEVADWAHPVVERMEREPLGDWFLTVAAALEFMHHQPLTAAERAQLAALEAEDADGDEAEGKRDRDEVRTTRHEDTHTEDFDEDVADAQAREEAGNDWLTAQGFDRKD
jgi:hypothetical protein